MRNYTLKNRFNYLIINIQANLNGEAYEMCNTNAFIRNLIGQINNNNKMECFLFFKLPIWYVNTFL